MNQKKIKDANQEVKDRFKMECKCVTGRSLESDRFVTCKISNEEQRKDEAKLPIKQNDAFGYAPFEANP